MTFQHSDRKSLTTGLLLRSTFLRGCTFALLWWGLSEGRIQAPLLALSAIVLATLASQIFVPPGTWKIRLLALLRFLPFFLLQSLLAGLDVSKRALAPSLPVSPKILRFPLTMRSPAGRIYLVWIVSLLPGTASVALDADFLTVHVLSGDLPHEERLRELEDRIAKMFEDDLNIRQEPS